MMSDAVKHFLKQYSYLVDKKDYEAFLNQLWEENLTPANTIELFKILDSINKNEFSNNLIFGITGSRKNRNIFTIDRKSFGKR